MNQYSEYEEAGIYLLSASQGDRQFPATADINATLVNNTNIRCISPLINNNIETSNSIFFNTYGELLL